MVTPDALSRRYFPFRIHLHNGTIPTCKKSPINRGVLTDKLARVGYRAITRNCNRGIPLELRVEDVAHP